MDARLPRAATAAATVLALACAPLLLFVLVERARPEPFTTSMDNFLYFAPLIGAQSDAWLSGAPLRVAWGLGAGWTPWQSGQTGVMWPLYVVAAALARATGVRLLELSALLSLLTSSLVTFALLPRALHGDDARRRVLVALTLALAPGPIVIGLNWHNYLAPAPAVLATALLTLRLARGDDDATRRALRFRGGWLVVACGLFFAGAHAQMYAIGIVMIALFALGAADNTPARVRAVGLLALAQLPLLAPLVWLKLLASNMAPDWVSSHAGPAVLVSSAVPTDQALLGTLFGTLFSDAQGRGVFFNPLFVALLTLVIVARRGWWTPFIVVSVALVVPRLVPGIEHLAVGPFEGFRWPRKIAVYSVPLTLLAVAHLTSTTSRVPSAALRVLRAPALWAALLVAQCAVVIEAAAGSSLRDARDAGASAVIDATRSCARALGIEEGARVALVRPLAGKLRAPNSGRALPPAYLGFAADAPLLAGLESAHLYEPMEQAAVALQHGSLGAYWRRSVDPQRLRAPQLDDEARALAGYGTQWLVALAREDLGELGDEAHACATGAASAPPRTTTEPGESSEPSEPMPGEPTPPALFAARVPGASLAVPSFPAFDGAPLARESDGTLTTTRPLTPGRGLTADTPGGPVPITWRKLADGRWRGTPRGPPAAVVAGAAFGVIAAVALLALLDRRRRQRHGIGA